jgi:hypothetical protein
MAEWYRAVNHKLSNIYVASNPLATLSVTVHWHLPKAVVFFRYIYVVAFFAKYYDSNEIDEKLLNGAIKTNKTTFCMTSNMSGWQMYILLLKFPFCLGLGFFGVVFFLFFWGADISLNGSNKTTSEVNIEIFYVKM